MLSEIVKKAVDPQYFMNYWPMRKKGERMVFPTVSMEIKTYHQRWQ